MKTKNSVISPYLIIILIFFVIALIIIGRILIVGQQSTEEQVCKASLVKASTKLYGVGGNQDMIQCNAKVITITDEGIMVELLTSEGRYLTEEEAGNNIYSFLASEINSCFAMAGIETDYCRTDNCILKCAHIRNEKDKYLSLDSDISDSTFDGFVLDIGDNTNNIKFPASITKGTEYILGVESFNEDGTKGKRIILIPIQDAFTSYIILN